MFVYPRMYSHDVKWTNLNPLDIISKIKAHGYELEQEDIFKRVRDKTEEFLIRTRI